MCFVLYNTDASNTPAAGEVNTKKILALLESLGTSDSIIIPSLSNCA